MVMQLSTAAASGIAAADLAQAIVRYGQNTLRAWRAVLADLEERQRGYVPAADRDDLAAMADHMRLAVQAFERAMVDGSAAADRDTAQVDWFLITTEMARCEADGWAVWQRVKDAAAADLAAGRTAAAAVESTLTTPQERAEFMAQRAALADGLRPANGLDWTLVDAMTEALVMYRRWLRQHAATEAVDARRVTREMEQRGDWQPPRIEAAEAVDRAAMMADRFLRSFLRLHKAYRDNRRILANVTVMGGQVNVAQDQVVAAAPKTRSASRKRKPATVVVDADYVAADSDDSDG